MFTIYIDDSGTAPDQKIAIASALIVPAKRITALHAEWDTFRAKEEFTDLHTSECVWRNPRSQFSKWDDPKVSRVLCRARQIAKKYGVQAISFAVNKRDYDEVIPEEWRETGGRYHYTWAVRRTVYAIESWCRERAPNSPIEYVFDSMEEKKAKWEIDLVMAQEESVRPGRYEGHYSFGKRQELPGLQCSDLIAWTCFQQSRLAFERTPITEWARVNLDDFLKHKINKWLLAITTTKQHLKNVVEEDQRDDEGEKRRRDWFLRNGVTWNY